MSVPLIIQTLSIPHQSFGEDPEVMFHLAFTRRRSVVNLLVENAELIPNRTEIALGGPHVTLHRLHAVLQRFHALYTLFISTPYT